MRAAADQTLPEFPVREAAVAHNRGVTAALYRYKYGDTDWRDSADPR